jgi:hypothetical protein
MATDKQLYDLYIKEMEATTLQVDKKLAVFADSFAKRVINEPDIDIAKIYREEVRAFNIIDEQAKIIQGGMINQTAIGYGILPDFSAEIMSENSTADLQAIFGKRKGKSLSKGVYDSVENSQKTIYKSISENAKLNKTWKETSTEIRKTLKGSLKGYDNLPNSIKELEKTGKKLLDNTNNRTLKSKFEKQLISARKEIENLSDNRALKQGYKRAFNKLDKAITNNDKLLFENAIKRATLEKNQSLSERTIITEQSGVFEQSRYDERLENPLVIGITFNLSSDHTIVDQCDTLASYDSGAGEGVYSLEEQPLMPIHANGVSFLTDVLIDELTDKQQKALKYNRSGITKAGEKAGLYQSQIDSLKNMEFMQPVKIDKEVLAKTVKKPSNVKKETKTENNIDLGFNKKYNNIVNTATNKATYDIIDKLPKPKKIGSGAGSYHPWEKKVLAKTTEPDVFIHEYGHFIDDITGNKSKELLSNAALSDAKKIGVVKDKRINFSKLEKLKDEWRIMEDVYYTSGRDKGKLKGRRYTTKTRFQYSASDIIDSMTTGYFQKTHKMPGHGIGYYKTGSAMQSENFANLFLMYSDDDLWKQAQKLFPSLTKEFKKIMDGI